MTAIAAIHEITAPQLLKRSHIAPPPIKEGIIMTIPIPRLLLTSIDSLPLNLPCAAYHIKDIFLKCNYHRIEILAILFNR
jgi:hypothetical protein